MSGFRAEAPPEDRPSKAPDEYRIKAKEPEPPPPPPPPPPKPSAPPPPPPPPPSPRRDELNARIRLQPEPTPSPRRDELNARIRLQPEPTPSPRRDELNARIRLQPEPTPSPRRDELNAVCPTCNDKFQPFDKNLINANRLAFHEKCFKCSQCANVIGEHKDNWVVHDGKVFCTPCHKKEVVNKCIKCKGGVSPDKQHPTAAGIVCPKCFQCHTCKRKLDKNAKFSELVGAAQLYCDRCTAAYQKAKYQFEMNRPGV